MITLKQIEQIKDKIVSEFHPNKIILFGSYAHDNATENSDLDLLIVQESNLSRHSRAISVRKLLRGSGFPIDVIVFTEEEIERWSSVSNAFITQIVNNGKVLIVTKRDLVKEWMIKAEHDIGTAKLVVDNDMIYTDQICYHSQQAVEKCFKAILADNELEIPKTHNLGLLVEQVSGLVEIDEIFYDIADVLDSYAIDVRYPMGDFEPSNEEAKLAFDMAQKVFSFVSNLYLL